MAKWVFKIDSESQILLGGSFEMLRKDVSRCYTKLYIPSTLNIDHLLWHTQLIVCAENVKSWFKSRRT